MNKLIYLLLLSIFLFDYISSLGFFSRYVTWLPELLSVITTLIISARITVGYGNNLPPVSGVFIFLLLLNITIGAFTNHVSEGTLIAGIRTYLKFIPFFILPLVYSFSEDEINKQLKLIFLLLLIQTPIALYQRLIMSTGLLSLTGDLVKGTFVSSGQLTVILCCSIAVLITLFLKKKLSLKLFIVIFIWLFIPMTINETKSTIIFLPIALILPLYFSSHDIKLKQLIPLISLMMLAGVAFVFIYDHFMRPRWGYGIIDFLFMEGRAEGYLYTGDTGAGTGVIERVGRVDSWVLAFKILYDDVLKLFFGLGIGNVSESFNPSLSGEYSEKYSTYNVKVTSLTLILWELGISGVVIYYYLVFISFKYALELRLKENFLGTLCSGFSTIYFIIIISILYSNVILTNVIGYLFFYFSGYIISVHYKYKNIVF